MQHQLDNRLIILSSDDSVVVARCSIFEGDVLVINGQTIVLSNTVGMGDKLAYIPMATGDKVLKYGVPIGLATTEISVGDHVHLHNIKSNYTATYSLAQAQAEYGRKS